MSSIGAVLKEARTKKTLSLDEVHSKIKIHPRMLQLLEEDKFERLPSPLFVKSFLRSYAEFLEVNSDELVSAYEKEKKEEPEQLLHIKLADPVMGTGYRPFHVIAGICAVLVLVFVLLGQPSKLARSWTALFKPAKVVSDKSKKASSSKAHDQDSVKVAAQETKEISKDDSEWLNSVQLGNFPKINRKTPLSLEIKVLDAVWIHVTCDGKVVFQGILKKGGAETWTAKDAIEIWTGNASNMSLILNKSPLGSPGKGVVKKMLISRDGVRIASASSR